MLKLSRTGAVSNGQVVEYNRSIFGVAVEDGNATAP